MTVQSSSPPILTELSCLLLVPYVRVVYFLLYSVSKYREWPQLNWYIKLYSREHTST